MIENSSVGSSRSRGCLSAKFGRAQVLLSGFSPLLALMGMLFLPSHLAWGQAFVNGAISGTVADSSGAVVPDGNSNADQY